MRMKGRCVCLFFHIRYFKIESNFDIKIGSKENKKITPVSGTPVLGKKL